MKNDARGQYRRRMERAYKDKWAALSYDTQEAVLDELLHIDGEDRLQNREELKGVLESIKDKRIAFGGVILGSLIGVAGSMLGGVIEDYVGSVLPAFIIVAFFAGLIWASLRTVEDITNEDHRTNKTLESLLVMVTEREQNQIITEGEE